MNWRTFDYRRAMLSFCLGLTFCDSVGAEEQAMLGTISNVTLYREHARVVREFEIPADQDLQQIRVRDLPRELLIGSAFADADPGTHVRSLRITSQTIDVDSDSAEKLRLLRSRNGELQQKLREAEHQSLAIEQDLLMIDKLVNFGADKAKENLDRATLDVSAITELADFAMRRRRDLAKEFMQSQVTVEQLQKDVEENTQQQEQFRSAELNPTYEALLAILSPKGGTVRLTYLVGNASWSPRYSIHSIMTDAGTRKYMLQLDALVVQDSGEPWDDVSLTLSTSTPDRQATRPLLTPLRVQAVASDQHPTFKPHRAGSPRDMLTDWLDRGVLERDVYLNSLANQTQVTELTTAAEIQRKLAIDAGEDMSDENYPVEKRTTLVNHPEHQAIAVLSEELSGEMHHVVTPLLSSFAFREAELTNTSGRNLIAGVADVYLDQELVGQATVPPTAAGQRLTIGFGTDRGIRTRRELLSKEETVQGGNRRSTLQVRLVISNYYEQPVAIRLLDRIPIAAKDGSINVSLDARSTESLSDDAMYLRMQQPTGVLRWDLEIPAMRFGSDAYDYQYTYSIELDRQHTIVSEDMAQTQGDLRFQIMNSGGMGGGMGMFMGGSDSQ